MCGEARNGLSWLRGGPARRQLPAPLSSAWRQRCGVTEARQRGAVRQFARAARSGQVSRIGEEGGVSLSTRETGSPIGCLPDNESSRGLH